MVELSNLQRGDKIRVTWLDAVQTLNLKEEDLAHEDILPFLATYIVVDEGVFLNITKAQTGHEVLVMLQKKKTKITSLGIPTSLIIKVEKISGPYWRGRKKVKYAPHAARPIIGVQNAREIK